MRHLRAGLEGEAETSAPRWKAGELVCWVWGARHGVLALSRSLGPRSRSPDDEDLHCGPLYLLSLNFHSDNCSDPCKEAGERYNTKWGNSWTCLLCWEGEPPGGLFCTEAIMSFVGVAYFEPPEQVQRAGDSIAI